MIVLVTGVTAGWREERLLALRAELGESVVPPDVNIDRLRSVPLGQACGPLQANQE